MPSSGPRWSLYPLLAVVAFFEFGFGVVHAGFCSPFFFLLLPVLNASLGLVTAFHAIFLRYPNRCDFYLQLSCTLLGFIFTASSLLESYCIGDFKYSGESMKEGVCHGMKYRTIGIVGSCNDFLGNLQLSIIAKFGGDDKARESVRFYTSVTLSVLSALHLAICTLLTFYSAVETKIRLYAYHYQIVTGLLIMFFSLFHMRFCCTFFFLHIPLAIGLFSIVQGGISWRNKNHGPTSRSFNVIGAAMALILNATTVFGIYCWSHRNDVPTMLTRHCHWQQPREDYCLRVVHFTHPYIDWLPQDTEREIAAIQITVYIFLFLLTVLQFAFSMKSAFSTKNIYLYY
ncbi:unnamed protein product [Caenorhabditis auriculariae]|uniref:Uncharacterized protein n=1 Tax=Caenorhabditis auriculariae TaxID=2777116 RepID=A0A8S1HH23_9PELO|nr:unnamed protein product [Caenorhabditis auriculariae]